MLFNIYSLKAKGVQVHFETSAEQIHCPGKGQKLRGKGVVCREPYRYEPFPKTDRCSGLKFNIGCVLVRDLGTHGPAYRLCGRSWNL